MFAPLRARGPLQSPWPLMAVTPVPAGARTGDASAEGSPAAERSSSLTADVPWDAPQCGGPRACVNRTWARARGGLLRSPARAQARCFGGVVPLCASLAVLVLGLSLSVFFWKKESVLQR